MYKRVCRTAAALIAAAVLFSVPCRAEPLISAQSAIVMDAASGRILFEKDAERRALIASTTKIMTALLIAENCNPDSVVSIPEEAAGIEGSSLYLKAGDCRTVEELLYGMMLHSGNDAAAALAGYCCGSEAAFVECMNDRAGELGLSETSFANPHGLDSEKNYSTAKELAVLAAAAMENPLFRRVVGTKTISFGDRTYTNHNKLLFRNSDCIGIFRRRPSPGVALRRRAITIPPIEACGSAGYARLLQAITFASRLRLPHARPSKPAAPLTLPRSQPTS